MIMPYKVFLCLATRKYITAINTFLETQYDTVVLPNCEIFSMFNLVYYIYITFIPMYTYPKFHLYMPNKKVFIGKM